MLSHKHKLVVFCLRNKSPARSISIVFISCIEWLSKVFCLFLYQQHCNENVWIFFTFCLSLNTIKLIKAISFTHNIKIAAILCSSSSSNLIRSYQITDNALDILLYIFSSSNNGLLLFTKFLIFSLSFSFEIRFFSFDKTAFCSIFRVIVRDRKVLSQYSALKSIETNLDWLWLVNATEVQNIGFPIQFERGNKRVSLLVLTFSSLFILCILGIEKENE